MIDRSEVTPTELIMAQINILAHAREILGNAINDITSTICPDTATWADATRLAHLVDAVKRAGLTNV